MFDEQEAMVRQDEQYEEEPPVWTYPQTAKAVKKHRQCSFEMIRAIKDLDILTSSNVEVKKRLIEIAKERKSGTDEENNTVKNEDLLKTEDVKPAADSGWLPMGFPESDSGWQNADSEEVSANEREPESDELPAIGTDEFERMKQELLADVSAIVAQGISMAIQQNQDDELTALITHCTIPGCVVHTVNFSGDIEEHFTRADLLDYELDVARSYLIRDISESISHIEAFKQRLHVVYQSGAVETVSLY